MFEVLEQIVDDEDALCQAEQKWIDHFVESEATLYNVNLVAHRPKNRRIDKGRER